MGSGSSTMMIATGRAAARVTLLSNGRPVVLRRLRSADEGGVRAMLERCSEETLQRRFLAPTPRITAGLARRLVDVDGERLEGYVAIVRGVVVGLGHIGFVASDRREIAILVEDEMQRSGIGTLIAARLLESVASQGISWVTAIISSDNRQALALSRRLLPDAQLMANGSSLEVVAPTPPLLEMARRA